MAISTQVPENWNVPLFWATVDGSMAGNLNQAQPALLVGQYFTTGAQAGTIGVGGANVPVPIGNPSQATLMFGAGSMLDRMTQAWFQVNVNQLLYALPLIDNAAGVAATWTITITTSATASGTLNLYIAGQLVQIVCQSTDTPTTEAAALAAAINAIIELPVTATAAIGVVTLTCKWKGLTGNDIQIIPNYYGLAGGQILPTGMALTIATVTAGTANPTMTTAIANIQAFQYLYVCMPYTDAASMQIWNTEFGFGAAGRWNYSRQQYGFTCNAYRNDYADALTFGATVNSPTMSSLVIEPPTQSPVWEIAAEYTGLAALGFTDDPARPLQTLEFQNQLPAQLQSRFSIAQQNNLTNGGFAIQGVDQAGNMQILREQTQYQFNSFGQSDTAFGLLTVLATLAELLTRMKAAITTKYPRVKLIPNGTRIGPGQAAVTPSDITAELISEFNQAQFDGLVADITDFVNNLVVEIDDNNPNRVNVLWPPQLAGQLRIFAALAQFRLLYPPVALN
jgi:phage tail sheath gpL-like